MHINARKSLPISSVAGYLSYTPWSWNQVLLPLQNNRNTVQAHCILLQVAELYVYTPRETRKCRQPSKLAMLPVAYKCMFYGQGMLSRINHMYLQALDLPRRGRAERHRVPHILAQGLSLQGPKFKHRHPGQILHSQSMPPRTGCGRVLYRRRTEILSNNELHR